MSADSITRLKVRVIRMLALASLGRLHGIQARIKPLKGYYGRVQTAAELISITWRTECGWGLRPTDETMHILDRWEAYHGGRGLDISRPEWTAAVRDAMDMTDETVYGCYLCTDPSPGVPGPHPACVRKTNLTAADVSRYKAQAMLSGPDIAHCSRALCSETRSEPDQFGRTCGCSCVHCNGGAEDIAEHAGPI